ncbi:MAG: hypothetical protein QOG70_163 [Solirubrobacteraceae bacterium]|jgi:hypothetical protein|nr:hypothetical protein [Solirubrobacteraceae bacterium]
MLRRAIPLLCLLALGVAACGGSDADDARKAAQTYVGDLGSRDGKAVCADMTKALQRRFTTAVVRANPTTRGRSCASLMGEALSSIPASQLKRFAGAKIDSVQVKGPGGTFVYRLGSIKVDGQVAKENGAWKVSCCVPGQG